MADCEGSIVTAQLITREVHFAARVESLGTDGKIETLEATTIHRFWSEERNDLKGFCLLHAGEQLDGWAERFAVYGRTTHNRTGTTKL